jgi:hypothetical protein
MVKYYAPVERPRPLLAREDSVRRPLLIRLSALLAALLVGVGIAIVDRGQDEVQPAVFLLLVAAFAFSCARPRDAWVYALLLGAGVPGLDLWTRVQGIAPAADSVPGSTVLAFLPAALGALLGAGARAASRAFGKGPDAV